MTESTTLTVRVSTDIKARLEAVAERTKRSKSFLAGEAIEEFVEMQEWQIDGINKALISLDSGQKTSHKDVSRWVQSWDTDEEMSAPKP